MADQISNHPSPGEPGTKVDNIQTPMCSTNVGKKNTPGMEKYSGTMNLGGGKGKGGSMSVVGPGAVKNGTGKKY